MALKFNALTGKLDYYESTSIGEVVGAILTDLDTTEIVPLVEILFDDEGDILYLDDNEEV